MTIRIHADTFVDENSWKLFAGRTTEGDPLQSMDRFPVQNSYYYLDFCLDSGLYTFVGYDSFGDGWAYGAGYTLTVDVGGMEVEIEELGEAPLYFIAVIVYARGAISLEAVPKIQPVD